jgi:glucoselysine-6-phosphate deglycase
VDSTNLMQAYINEQSTILRAILGDRKQLVDGFIERFRYEKIDRVVLIGSGSSYHAGIMAKQLIEKALEVEVTTVVPSRMNDINNIAEKHVLYFALSQGGRSTNTLQVINELHKNGNLVVAITQFKDSPITKIADLSLYLPIGEENIGAKTKGVSATTLILMLACFELGFLRGIVNQRVYDEMIEAAYYVANHMDENIQRILVWSKSIIPALSSMYTLDIIAKGNDFGAAMEGRLKLLETIWKPVICFEFEEYLHGPENALDENTCGLLVYPDDCDQERMQRLRDFANSKGAHFFQIDRYNDPTNSQRLSLISANNSYWTCFELLPVFQTLSAQLSAHYEIDLTHSKYPDFIQLMGTKIY